MNENYLQHIAASYEAYPEFDCIGKLARASEAAQSAYDNPSMSEEDRYARLYEIVDQTNRDLEGQNVILGEGSVLVNHHAFYAVSASWEDEPGKAYDENVPPPVAATVPVLGPIFGAFEGLVVRDLSGGTTDTGSFFYKIYCQIQPIRNEDDVLPQEIPPDTPLLLPLEHFEQMLLLQPTPAVHPAESQLMHAIVDLANIPSSVRAPQHINAIFQSIVTNHTLREIPWQKTTDWIIDQYNEYLGYQNEFVKTISSEAVVYTPETDSDEPHGEIIVNAEIQGQAVGFVDMQNYQKIPGQKSAKFIPYYRPPMPILGLAIIRKNEDDEPELIHVPLQSCRTLQVVHEPSEVQ